MAFGPYHRLSSPTQTRDTATAQQAAGEIWGYTPRGSSWPQVQAYNGPLPAGSLGIEFETDLAPSTVKAYGEVRWWDDGLAGIRTDPIDDKVILTVRILKIDY